MSERIKRARRGAGLHLRRQAIAYVALAVALGGSAYAAGGGRSGKVGGKDLKPMVARLGQPVSVQPGESTQATAECRRGERALAPLGFGESGGDGATVLSAIGVIVHKKGKSKSAFISGFNTSTSPKEINASVLCLKP
jgi:hypothetical protein